MKMVSYYLGNTTQVFATFEYQRFKFDMFKNLEEYPAKWDFIEDQNFNHLKKIANTEFIRKKCQKDLDFLDNFVL